MHGKEFERKVQQQMEELKLSPSDVVWQQVQAGIKKGKRKKFMWRFVPAAAVLLLLMSGYLLFVSKENGSHSGKNDTVLNKQNDKAISEQQLNNQQTDELDLYTQKNKNSLTAGKDIAPKNADSATIIEHNNIAKINNSPENGSLTQNAISADKKTINKKQKPESIIGSRVPAPAYTDNSADKNNIVVANNKNKRSGIVTKNSNNNFGIVTDNNINNSVEEELRHAVVAGTNAGYSPVRVDAGAIAITNEKPRQKARKYSAWKWGVQVTPGLSNVTKTFTTNEPNYALSNTGGPYSRGNSYTVPNPDNNNGFAFNAGVFVKKMFKKTYVDIGVNYSYFSSSIRVGSKVDSTAVVRTQNMDLLSVNTFYEPGNSNTYHNKYHFIEIPLSFGMQLFNLGNTKINANIGASYAYMVSGKMLFNSSYDTHFENKSLLNRSQVFVHAGIGVLLNEHAKLPVTIGPVVTYGATRIADPSSSTGQHIISVGLKTSFELQKIF